MREIEDISINEMKEKEDLPSDEIVRVTTPVNKGMV
jgi:hypothetical protein